MYCWLHPSHQLQIRKPLILNHYIVSITISTSVSYVPISVLRNEDVMDSEVRSIHCNELLLKARASLQTIARRSTLVRRNNNNNHFGFQIASPHYNTECHQCIIYGTIKNVSLVFIKTEFLLAPCLDFSQLIMELISSNRGCTTCYRYVHLVCGTGLFILKGVMTLFKNPK